MQKASLTRFLFNCLNDDIESLIRKRLGPHSPFPSAFKTFAHDAAKLGGRSINVF
ncbi:MAG: hypothetical protein JWM99_3109 [Verrucomicrobiales bacterium]|nr:hypothetical protein [Verrucomicrobiales bacterium]